MTPVPPTAPTECSPSWLRWVTRASIVLGIGALVATVAIVGPSTIIGHLRTIGWWFVLLIAIEIFSTCLDATAVYLVTRGDGAPRYREVIVAQFAGRAVNTVTPAGNLGEALKVSLLARHCPPQRIVAGVMYVGLTMVVVSLAMVAVGSAATALLFDMPQPAMLFVLGGALAAGVIAAAIVVLIRRGMLSSLANAAARIHVISKARRAKWTKNLDDVDARLRGDVDHEHRRAAAAFVLISQVVQKALAYVTVLAAGYDLSAAQFLGLVSLGVLLGWISTIIPMGLGISEGGNVALFTLLGAPAALGVALALARRVNQVVFALIGFTILAGNHVAAGVHAQVKTRVARRRTLTAPITVQP